MPFSRLFALLLILPLILPSPAYGLRKQQAADSPADLSRLAAGMEADAAELKQIREKIRKSSRQFGIPIPENAGILLFFTRRTSGVAPRVTSKVFAQLSQELKLSRTYVRIPYLIEKGNVQEDLREFLMVLKLAKQGFEVDGHPIVAATAGFPFKEAGTSLLDERDPAFLNAPSTEFFVRKPDGRFWGTLIDEKALREWYEDSVGSLEGLQIVMLGAGGVGSGFIEELVQRKTGRIVITDINKEKVEEALRRFSGSDIPIVAVEPDDLPGRIISAELHRELARADTVFNLTALGRRDVSGPVSPVLAKELQYKDGAVIVDATPHYILQDDNVLTQARRVNPNVRTEDGAGMAIYSNSSIITTLLNIVDGVNVEKRKVRDLVRTAEQEVLSEAAGMEQAKRFETVRDFMKAYRQELRSGGSFQRVAELRRRKLQAEVWVIPKQAVARQTVRVYVAAESAEEQGPWESAVRERLNGKGDKLSEVLFVVEPYPGDKNLRGDLPAVVIRQTGAGPLNPNPSAPVVTLSILDEVKQLVPSWVYALAVNRALDGMRIGPVLDVVPVEDGFAVFV